MALTRLDHTGDGVRTVYDLTFTLGYLQESDIYVSLDTNDYTNQLSYSFLNSTKIVLDTPVSSGVGFNIRRVVDRSQPINDYEEGAILRENNLDDSFAQALMILEEVEDGYLSSTDLQLETTLDMTGHRIINVGEAIDPADAVSKNVTDELGSRLSALESGLETSVGSIILVYDYTSVGGEVILDVPYDLEVVHSVTINGVRQIKSTATEDGAWELDLGVITIAEPLEVGDTVSVDIVEIN